MNACFRVQTIFFKNKSSVNENENSETVKSLNSNEVSSNEKSGTSNSESSQDKNREEVLLQENKSLTEKVNEIDDKYKRALAETENMR